jgi:hypothetical protein
LCKKTFTFLPLFSPPYGHYSLIARSQALRRYFVEGCDWQAAAPTVQDPDRVADPSTLRPTVPQPGFLPAGVFVLRQTMPALRKWLSRTEVLVQYSLPLRWHTVFPFLARYWPLRL